MSKKVETDLVKMVMTRNGLDGPTVAQIIEDINSELQAQTEDEEKPPPIKKQFVMVVSDPEDTLNGKILTGWVLQIPEEDSPHVAEERLFRLGYEYNMSKKGRRVPVKTVAEICENVPARIQKEQKVWVKTKEPVYAIPTRNKLPTEAKDL
ncbi:MAG: hypothetical protein AAFX93_15810 [Verrucomicrobiota bacterium]